MKTFLLGWPGLEIEITCSDEDYEWLHPLMTRHDKPFKALRNMGYDLVDKRNETESKNDS